MNVLILCSELQATDDGKSHGHVKTIYAISNRFQISAWNSSPASISHAVHLGYNMVAAWGGQQPSIG